MASRALMIASRAPKTPAPQSMHILCRSRHPGAVGVELDFAKAFCKYSFHIWIGITRRPIFSRFHFVSFPSARKSVSISRIVASRVAMHSAASIV
jgi:hypothetical protein